METKTLTRAERQARTLAFVEGMQKHKDETQARVWRDYEAGKYDKTIKELDRLNKERKKDVSNN
jgi:hypothetical protein